MKRKKLLENKRDGSPNKKITSCKLLYAMCVTLFSTFVFLNGFFPLKLQDEGIATMRDVPSKVEDVRVNTQLLYRPLIKKLVIMIIDGLRWDFVAGPIGEIAMPITRSLIDDDEACLLQAKAASPTVTMPRLKAITTGAAPMFVDVVLNFGSKSISGDSLLLQAKNHGHKLIFYGDDTWLKLFPDIFSRSDGTTSFYVTDYTEVDNNVTRHIDEELNRSDWSIMVLHYLGLDHIGHIAGPQSPLIYPKLREMDEIIGRIQSRVSEWQEQGDPTLFVVCGDHGMKDSGGHGGNTPQEILVPFVAIGASCPGDYEKPYEMEQIDISSTLAMLLGIPIPSSSLGMISLPMLGKLSTSRKLFSLYYNALQVFMHYRQIPGFETTRAYENYVNATKLHSAWLETSGQTIKGNDEIIGLYENALRGMRDKLTSTMTKYDTRVMTIAMFFMFHVLYIMINTHRRETIMPRHVVYFVSINVILWLSLDYFLDGSGESILLSHNANSYLILALSADIFFANCYFCTNLELSFESIKKHLTSDGTMQCILLSGTLFHALSLSSSSFVEEEHRTWFFFWTTFCILLFYRNVRSLTAQSQRYHLNSPHEKMAVELFLCLLAHAVLRHLNSTGDMYAHLPDIADWLQQDESRISMTVLLISALSCLVWIGYTSEEIRYKKYALLMYVTLATCIYLRHMVTGSVLRIPFYPASRGIYEVQAFWCLMLVYLTCTGLRLEHMWKRSRRDYLLVVLRFIIEYWVMISAMLHRPYNVGLLPIQLLVNTVIVVALRRFENRETLIHVHYWLGNVFYFYQGNSNNLSTIDVAAGYVGMESYNPFTTGIFLVINTYSAPILAYLTLLYAIVSENKSRKLREDIIEINRRYAAFRLLPLAVYTVVVTIQRYHLFVWTVFSPKLLYEAMYCAVMYVVMFCMNVIFVIIVERIN